MLNKKELYSRVIDVLNMLELIIEDEKQFLLIRKKLLNLANDILRGDDNA